MDRFSLICPPASTSRNTIDHGLTIGKVVLIVRKQKDALATRAVFVG